MISINKSKFIKSLKIKKYRGIERCFLVEGRKNVKEVLQSTFKVQSVIGTRAYLDREPEELTSYQGELLEASEAFLVEAGTFQSNQDCIAVVEMPAETLISPHPDQHLFLLDGISDPGNLGTIIRTLDWFGFTQVACSPDTADFYNPKVINSTMGSFCRVQVAYQDLDTLIKTIPRPVFGTDMLGEPLSSGAITEPSYIIMGSESHGVRDYLLPLLTKRITIPALGRAESLNVGVATGIIAYQLTNS